MVNPDKLIESEEMIRKKDVVKMLREMQISVANCHCIIAGFCTQSWVISELLGNKIKSLGGGDTVIMTMQE